MCKKQMKADGHAVDQLEPDPELEDATADGADPAGCHLADEQGVKAAIWPRTRDPFEEPCYLADEGGAKARMCWRTRDQFEPQPVPLATPVGADPVGCDLADEQKVKAGIWPRTRDPFEEPCYLADEDGAKARMCWRTRDPFEEPKPVPLATPAGADAVVCGLADDLSAMKDYAHTKNADLKTRAEAPTEGLNAGLPHNGVTAPHTAPQNQDPKRRRRRKRKKPNHDKKRNPKEEPQENEENPLSVFIKGLARTKIEKDEVAKLKALLERTGCETREVRLMVDQERRTCRGYAMVDMENIESVEKALALNGQEECEFGSLHLAGKSLTIERRRSADLTGEERYEYNLPPIPSSTSAAPSSAAPSSAAPSSASPCLAAPYSCGRPHAGRVDPCKDTQGNSHGPRCGERFANIRSCL